MTTRLPGSWHHHLQKAEFDEFVFRDGTGRVHFHGQHPTVAGARTSPVFWRIRPPRQTTEAWHLRRLPLAHVIYKRSMPRAYRIELARRWQVGRPLTRQWFRVDEAISATRGTRA